MSNTTMIIKDSHNNMIISSGNNILVPRVGDRVYIKNRKQHLTVGDVFWQFEDSGTTIQVYLKD